MYNNFSKEFDDKDDEEEYFKNDFLKNFKKL